MRERVSCRVGVLAEVLCLQLLGCQWREGIPADLGAADNAQGKCLSWQSGPALYPGMLKSPWTPSQEGLGLMELCIPPQPSCRRGSSLEVNAGEHSAAGEHRPAGEHSAASEHRPAASAQPAAHPPSPAHRQARQKEPWECWTNSSGRGRSLLKGQRFLHSAAVNSPASISAALQGSILCPSLAPSGCR